MPRPFEIVFVDVMDTLLRVHGSVGAVYAECAARYGFEAAPSAIDVAFEAAITAAPPPSFPDAPPEEHAGLERRWWHDVVARTFAALGSFPRFEAFFDDVFERFRTPQAWELLPGAREALQELQAGGRRLGIVSDIDGRVYDVLEGFGLRALFDPIVLASRMGRSKRDGGLFPLALAAARVAPADAVHVGDSLRADVRGAQAAGMTAVWFAGRSDEATGVVTARDWAEVVLRIRALEHDRTTGPAAIP